MDTYYNPEDLSKFEEIGKEAPELAQKFFEYYAAVFAEGELTEREKALIALAVAHTVQCPYCIDAYTKALSVSPDYAPALRLQRELSGGG